MFTRLRTWLGLLRFPQRFRLHEDFDLDGWLCIATEGLCAEARERIEMEMRRHVTETAAELLAEGLSPAEAFDAAVRQLGSAKAAHRGFCRGNLTQFEYGLCLDTRLGQRKKKTSGWWFALAIGYVVLLDIETLCNTPPTWTDFLPSQFCALFLLSLAAESYYRSRGSYQSVLGAKIMKGFLPILGLPLAWQFRLLLVDEYLARVILAFAAILYMYWGFQTGSLWLKLDRIGFPVKLKE